jgi:hypothetical protein
VVLDPADRSRYKSHPVPDTVRLKFGV